MKMLQISYNKGLWDIKELDPKTSKFQKYPFTCTDKILRETPQGALLAYAQEHPELNVFKKDTIDVNEASKVLQSSKSFEEVAEYLTHSGWDFTLFSKGDQYLVLEGASSLCLTNALEQGPGHNVRICHNKNSLSLLVTNDSSDAANSMLDIEIESHGIGTFQPNDLASSGIGIHAYTIECEANDNPDMKGWPYLKNVPSTFDEPVFAAVLGTRKGEVPIVEQDQDVKDVIAEEKHQQPC